MSVKKFFGVIGNPPYQEDLEGTSDRQIYNYFMDESFDVSDRVELITPGRFLFNAGKTPKAWNKKMLEDPHFKVLVYDQQSNNYFVGTDIKGGIAISYRDATQQYEPLEAFSPYPELRSIQQKVSSIADKSRLAQIMFPQNRFNLEALYKDYPEAKEIISSEGRERRIVTSSFEKLRVFSDTQTENDQVRILGLTNGNKRAYKWIKRKYVEDNGNLDCYKVILPMANGSGVLGETLSNPVIAEPNTGYTQTFLGIGAFTERLEAEAALKYVKTKMVRALLGILKITQHNTPEKWRFVPCQNFGLDSDIDWSRSVKDIDIQLYKKYGLTQEEVEFIESHVKEME